GCLAVALRPCRGPGSFERRLSTRRLRAGENEYGPENQPTHRRSQPPHGTLPQLAALLETDHILPGHALQRCPRALRLDVPLPLLGRADEVIEYAAMSATGPKRTYRDVCYLAAFGGKAD